jgi:hypothetical protein
MSTQEKPQEQIKPFMGAVDARHRRVDPCFMTGKGCIFTDAIEHSLNDRQKNGIYLGFSIMPFRENLNIFFKNCLSLYFADTHNFQGNVTLQRADEVRRPGIIICEGVCRRIQESDFVTADVSLPNPNVFYELGLAYGIRHKIVVIHHDESEFGKEITKVLNALGCKPYSYHNLDPIRREDFDREQFIWQATEDGSQAPAVAPKILLYEHHVPEGVEPKRPEEVSLEFSTHANGVPAGRLGILKIKETEPQKSDDISLAFSTHVMSAIGLGILKISDELNKKPAVQPVIRSYLDIINGFRDATMVKTDANLKEIQAQIDSAYCMIIRTGFRNCHPMTYFWLGYGHAMGKNVIPVTVLHERDDRVEDLAFDIRAQRHMFFYEKAPDVFAKELTSSLEQMIVADFNDWSRKRLWNRLLGRRGEVSIFTGALHNKTFVREMIGDWDLRAASELTSYFARQQYRATIVNPVYTPEYPKRDVNTPISQYITRLEELLKDRNCILIASPDVNPLTEVVLGKIYGIPAEKLFSTWTEEDVQSYPKAIVVVKEKAVQGSEDTSIVAQRFFYREVPPEKEGFTRRGFQSAQLIKSRIMEPFVSQVDLEKDDAPVFGQIVIFPNPYRSPKTPQRYIVILNGVSGPATFALTHVLTGGVTKEFVAYPDDFNEEAQSEAIVRQLLEPLSQPHAQGLDCLVTVHVGRKNEDAPPGSADISDWRKIRRWELNRSARSNPISLLP